MDGLCLVYRTFGGKTGDPMRFRRVIRILLAFGISTVLLLIALRNVSIGELMIAIASFDKPLLLLAILLWLGAYGIRAIRWKVFLDPISPTTLSDSYQGIMIGFATNNILPLRVGEVVRSYILHRLNPKIPTSSAFATVAGERLFDGIAVLVYTIIGTTVLSLPAWGAQAVEIGSVLFGLALVVFILMVFNQGRFVAVLTRFLFFLPVGLRSRGVGMMDNFISGLVSLKSFGSLGKIFAFSMFAWGVEVVFYLLATRSFGIEMNLLGAAFLMGIINLGVMIPAAPGGVGTYQFIAVQALLLFGISESRTFGFALVSNLLQNLSVIGIGLFFLSRLGLSVFSVSKISTLNEQGEKVDSK